MTVTRLPKWDITGIEIALDLEARRLDDPSRFIFSGPAEPRICLVAGFALTSQLERIVAAADRAAPARLPSGLRIAPTRARSAGPDPSPTISIQPMLPLMRLQSRLIQAIEPGLAHDVALHTSRGTEVTSVRFVAEFISRKALPTFEPARAIADFDAVGVTATGLTIYRLGDEGVPKSILAHWAYPRVPGIVRPRARP